MERRTPGADELPRWEHFAHGADIGVRGLGCSVASAFEQCALALTGVVTDPEKVRPEQAVPVHCEAPDFGVLLVDWLNALIYEMSVRHMLFSHFDVRLEGEHLDATAWGEPVDRDRHAPAVEVKGATMTALSVDRIGPGGPWQATCVLDV